MRAETELPLLCSLCQLKPCQSIMITYQCTSSTVFLGLLSARCKGVEDLVECRDWSACQQWQCLKYMKHIEKPWDLKKQLEYRTTQTNACCCTSWGQPVQRIAQLQHYWSCPKLAPVQFESCVHLSLGKATLALSSLNQIELTCTTVLLYQEDRIRKIRKTSVYYQSIDEPYWIILALALQNPPKVGRTTLFPKQFNRFDALVASKKRTRTHATLGCDMANGSSSPGTSVVISQLQLPHSPALLCDWTASRFAKPLAGLVHLRTHALHVDFRRYGTVSAFFGEVTDSHGSSSVFAWCIYLDVVQNISAIGFQQMIAYHIISLSNRLLWHNHPFTGQRHHLSSKSAEFSWLPWKITNFAFG